MVDIINYVPASANERQPKTGFEHSSSLQTSYKHEARDVFNWYCQINVTQPLYLWHGWLIQMISGPGDMIMQGAISMRALCRFLVIVIAVPAWGGDYFPDGTLGGTQAEHQFHAEWYSKHLGALGELSLWQVSRQQPTSEVYRFLWLRSFHHPLSLRLTVASDGTGTLACKETNGKGGYEPGKLIRNTIAKLSKQETQWFRDRLDEIGLWKLPTLQTLQPFNADVVGLDGAQWIAEASKAGRYHIVDRWSPAPGDPIHAFGTMLMIDLAHLKLLYQDVY